MECSEALEILEAEWLGVWDAEPQLVSEAQRHLAECARCRAAWPQRQIWGGKLAAAMQAVSTPAGLSDRLLAHLPQATVEARPHRISRRAWSGVAAALVLVVAALSFAFWPPPPPIELQSLTAAAEAPLDGLPAFSGRFTPKLPADWQPYFQLDTKQVSGFPAEGANQVGRIALVPFQFTLRRGVEPIQGRLLILKRWQLEPQDVPRGNFRIAEIRYFGNQKGAWIVWAEGDWIYACLIPSNRGPVDLEQLRQALLASRPLS